MSIANLFRRRPPAVTAVAVAPPVLDAPPVIAAPPVIPKDPAAAELQVNPLVRIVRPDARDRWANGRLSQYTPDQIDTILRGAASGDIRAMHEMFSAMEDSWDRLAKNLAELKGVVEEVQLPLQAWSADGEEPSPEALSRKALLEDAIWHMEPDPTKNENDFIDTLKDLADGWAKGVAIVEVEWAVRDLAGGRAIAPRSSSLVHSRHYGWPMAAGERLDRLMLRVNELPASSPMAKLGTEWIPFPKDKFLVAVAKHRSGHPTQTALLRPLAWWWAAQQFSTQWLLNFCQIFGLPIRWANYAAGTPDQTIRIIEEMLSDMGSSGYGLFPQGVSIELKEAVRGVGDNPNLAFKALADKVCDLIVLGQTLTSDVGQSGSRALGDVHKDVLSGRKRALINWLVRILNSQFVPAFCRLNFGDTRECPYFTSGYEEEQDPKAMAERDGIIVGWGLPVPKPWLYERHGIPAPKPGDDVLVGAQPQPPAGTLGTPPEMSLLQGAGSPLISSEPDAMDKLTRSIMEEAQPVEAKWLAGAVPYWRSLIAAASSPTTTEAQFEAMLARAIQRLPDEVGRSLDVGALASAMERHMGAAALNGWLKGWMQRKRAGKQTGS